MTKDSHYDKMAKGDDGKAALAKKLGIKMNSHGLKENNGRNEIGIHEHIGAAVDETEDDEDEGKLIDDVVMEDV